MSKPVSKDFYDDFPDHGPLPIRTLGDALNNKLPPLAYIIDNLIPEGKTVVVNVGPGVEPQMFMSLAVYCAAAGKDLPPFGKGKGVPVLVCIGSGYKYADEARLCLIAEKDRSTNASELAKVNLHFHHRDYEGGTARYLNSVRDQETFMASFPPGCKLIAFDNLAAWLKPGTQDLLYDRGFVLFLQALNSQGIAVLLFWHSATKADTVPDPVLGNLNHHAIYLTEDRGSLTEFGASFSITRRRLLENDPLPHRFQFWHTVIDGKLEFGWECREALDATSAKQIEITERRLKIEKMMAENKPQKEIAAVLGVDAATVSRDVAAVKQAKRKIDSGTEER